MPSSLSQILDRDGGACVWCGRTPWRSDLTVDHVLPRSRGGRGMSENLLVACRACNRRRGSRPVSAFVREQVEQGAGKPELDALRKALEGLAGSAVRPQREYARRQLSLLNGYTASSTEP